MGIGGGALTDLIRFQGEFYCSSFISGTQVRIMTSGDGAFWTSAALLPAPAPFESLLDPHLSITPGGDLMLNAAHWDGVGGNDQSFVWMSPDGANWGLATPIGLLGEWIWRTQWHKGVAYSFARDESVFPALEGTYLQLYSSTDGTYFNTLGPKYFEDTYPNEVGYFFMEDDTCWALLRRDIGETTSAQLGVTGPPYDNFTWTDLGVQIGGPQMIEMPNGQFLATTRLYNPLRTSFCWVDPMRGELIELLKLPGGGFTGYCGMVLYDNLLWVSFHLAGGEITLAKVHYTSTVLDGDLDVDGDIDLEDFSRLAVDWQELYGSEDLGHVTENWLQGR